MNSANTEFLPKYLLNAEIISALNEFNRLIMSFPYSGEYGSTFLTLSSSSIFSISYQLELYEETISSLRIDLTVALLKRSSFESATL